MTIPDFSQRSSLSELLDGNDLSYSEYEHCLLSLERINVMTMAYRPTLGWINQQMSRTETRTILDVGCGGGDMLRRIAKLTRKHNFKVELTGVDMNPWSRQVALSIPSPGIRYETADIFSYKPGKPFDYIICSLFTHHLDDNHVVEFLRWLHRSSRRGWFINDLRRHPLPYYFIKYATTLFSNNRLIRHDAAVSVSRSFTIRDWHKLISEAGLADRARVKSHFPFRLCISCSK